MHAKTRRAEERGLQVVPAALEPRVLLLLHDDDHVARDLPWLLLAGVGELLLSAVLVNYSVLHNLCPLL